MFSDDSIGEPDEDDDGLLPFIGRFREREETKTALKKRKCRVIQISGAPCIGKHRFVKQICEELGKESGESGEECNLHVCNISCKFLRTCDDLIERIKESLREFDNSVVYSGSTLTSLITTIKSHFKRKNFLILSFTKLDDFLFNDDTSKSFDTFSHFCCEVLCNSRNTFLILSSQTRLKLNLSCIPRHVTLTKLTSVEACTLLRQACRDIDFENYEKDIVNGCHRIPGLILEAASLLMSSGGVVKPDILADLLKSPQHALDFFSSHLGPQEEKLKCKIEKLLKRLPEVLQSSVTDLMLLQGDFSSDAMAAILGHKTKDETTMQVILPLQSASILEFNKENHMYSFSPFLRAYLNEIPLVCSSDIARLRFVKFFADVMVTVDQKLYQESHKHAQEYFHFNYGNVQQLMQQAIHCNQDIFKALMRAVGEAEELFIKCFPVERVKDFYNHLLQSAELFGEPNEIAILKMFLAQAMTQLKVDTNREEVSQLFNEAYSTFSARDSHDYHHMTLLGFMGRFSIRQGKYHDGLELIQRALDMKVPEHNQKRVYRRVIEFLVQQALGELFCENYEKAEKLLDIAHDIAQKEVPYHESVALISNTFGLICERSGRDEDKALIWYKSSLAERRKYEKFAPEMLVPPLNNIANQSVKRGNYEYAMKLLEEALEIRKRCGWNDYFTGLTLRQKAEICLAKGNVALAIKTCDEALQICQHCTPTHWFLNEIRLLRFHCHTTAKDWSSANSVYNTIMAERDNYTRNIPRGEQTLTVLFHSLLLREDDEWDNAYNELQVEVRRLRDLALESDDFDKYHQLQIKIIKGSQLFTSKREDSTHVHKQRCLEFVTENCKLCRTTRIE